MTIQHKSIAVRRWSKLSLIEQMANIGSEVERAISWEKKGNRNYSKKAFYRSLELLDLSISSSKKKDRLKELTRLKEALVDYFYADNQYSSSDKLWRKYFYPFNFAARAKY